VKNISGKTSDAPDAVTLIDAHHHLWDLSMARHPWLGDHPEPGFFLGDYSPLKKNYLPADYLKDSAGHNVLATVHCEAEWDRADQVGETRWISAVHARHGFPNAIVAHAWFHTPNAAEILEQQAAFPLVRGIRSKPVTVASPAEKPGGGPGTMRDKNWLTGLSRLERYGLTFDLRVPYWHLEEAAAVAAQFPNIPMVLNHTGFPWDRSPEGLKAWRGAMEIIARAPNMHLKISEFGLRDQVWDYESNRAIVREALAIFGIERCMFASNFPVAGLRIGYDALVRAVSRMVEDMPAAGREALFWRNAARFYRIAEPFIP
jgi:predicted TIM-barrel fold metal-dependent hydrolase